MQTNEGQTVIGDGNSHKGAEKFLIRLNQQSKKKKKKKNDFRQVHLRLILKGLQNVGHSEHIS
jgi:hypothetical protein